MLRPLGLVVALLVLFGLPLSVPAKADRGSEAPLIGPARGDALHVMSYNLRFASDRTPNSWPQRRPAMAELLRHEQPTVLGTQEGLYPQLKDIAADLPGYYDWIGEGRGGGSRDEFTAVFYDTRRLEPLAFDHFWLSDTPTVVGSNTWGNSVTRMVTWVRFADHRTGVELVVVNTHFDDQSDYARRRSAELLRDRINGFAPGLPVILTGDFNTAAAARTRTASW
ncbi:endonuclease/exonuclease/phosphatase family protein [Actinophytocola sp.]|uniref:endonuclease/exonuclease/phosphatase family protein n=1 Tax=Actinophytocola sp. TaxID=1872138 RepID=UPI0025BEBFEE|nr:endonuclease/exonuclease/phosphatase family protein [Actinophytocola sp.]